MFFTTILSEIRHIIRYGENDRLVLYQWLQMTLDCWILLGSMNKSRGSVDYNDP